MSDKSMQLEDWSKEPQRRFKVEAKADWFQPFEHQKAAWNAMDRHFLDERAPAGIVVVPTGGGKTTIASRWLLKNHVSPVSPHGGRRILWFAHRRSLLRQAYRDFAKAAHLASGLDYLSMIRVSSDDHGWSNVSDDHHIVFSMIQSAAREDTINHLSNFLDQSPKGATVVIDEAHHAAAPSYVKVLKKLQVDKRVTVLGLTATPVRMDEDDQKRLWKLFDRKLIYEVSKRQLTEQGILATPQPETVKTKVTIDAEGLEEHLPTLDKFGELTEHVLKKLGSHAARNRLIVEHYQKAQSKYGKTIVFAVNVVNAQTLAREFQKNNISADYVDYTRGEQNTTIMDDFRNSDRLSVLVNVEMLTEGFDAPQTQSVFIARPTRSAALLSQMIGRALRGTKAGGTEKAYLVTFVDTWKDYNPLDANFVITEEEPAPQEERGRYPQEFWPIPQDLIHAAYALLNKNTCAKIEGFYACVPHSWYVWDEVQEDDIQRRVLLVFDHQCEGYKLMEQELATTSTSRELSDKEANQEATAMRSKCFADCPDPRPSIDEVRA